MTLCFKPLTDFIDGLSSESPGEWVKGKKLPNGSIQLGYVNYSELVVSFIEKFYAFSKAHPEYNLTNYKEILEENTVKWDADDMRLINPKKLNAQCILALIMGAICADRFCEGALLGFLEDGSMVKWLEQLKKIEGMQE